MAHQELDSQSGGKENQSKGSPWTQPSTLISLLSAAAVLGGVYVNDKNSEIEREKLKNVINSHADQISIQREQLNHLYDKQREGIKLQKRQIKDINSKIISLKQEIKECDKDLRKAESDMQYYGLTVLNKVIDPITGELVDGRSVSLTGASPGLSKGEIEREKALYENAKALTDMYEKKRADLSRRLDELQIQKTEFVLKISTDK